jgi:hypothetical protein
MAGTSMTAKFKRNSLWPKEDRGMKKFLLILAALFALSAFVYAQTGVAGKWTGEQPGRGGAAGTPLTLELAVSDNTLTGKMTTGSDPGAAIADGKVDGMKVTFKVTNNVNGNSVDVMYSGEVNGNELTLTRQRGGGGGRRRGGGGGGGGRGGGGRGTAPIVLKRAS